MDLLHLLYLIIVAIGILMGVVNFKGYTPIFKLTVLLLVLTLISEMATTLTLKAGMGKSPAYHFFNPIEAAIISVIFLITVSGRSRIAYSIYVTLFWVCCGVANLYFFQPLRLLNSNFLILESFVVIAMSLYSLFTILADDSIHSPLVKPEFFLWVCFLVYFSSTFFFWSCVPTFYRAHSPFYGVAANIEMAANFLMYIGIDLILIFYPKMKTLGR